MDRLISLQAAIDVLHMDTSIIPYEKAREYADATILEIRNRLEDLPSAQAESTRTFVELVVKYPDPELCTYKEYKGKPYYSIKYIENGETYVGYGTYNPEVLSQYLKEYFISSAQPDIMPDGTLTVSIDADIANVGRILLSQAGTQRGGLYYKDEQPEIIRCRDCKFYTPLNRETKSGICSLLIHQDFGDDWYCAGAERKTDE